MKIRAAALEGIIKIDGVFKYEIVKKQFGGTNTDYLKWLKGFKKEFYATHDKITRTSYWGTVIYSELKNSRASFRSEGVYGYKDEFSLILRSSSGTASKWVSINSMDAGINILNRLDTDKKIDVEIYNHLCLRHSTCKADLKVAKLMLSQAIDTKEVEERTKIMLQESERVIRAKGRKKEMKRIVKQWI